MKHCGLPPTHNGLGGRVLPENWLRKWSNTSWVRKQVAQNEHSAGEMLPGSEHRTPAAGHNSRRVRGQQRMAEVAAAGGGGGVAARLRSRGRNDLGVFGIGATGGRARVGE
jgi:hypothetical protein